MSIQLNINTENQWAWCPVKRKNRLDLLESKLTTKKSEKETERNDKLDYLIATYAGDSETTWAADDEIIDIIVGLMTK